MQQNIVYNYLLSGMPVIVTDYLFEKETIPKKRHKKKRIQKKWIKKYGYTKHINYRVLIMDNKMYCHSKAIKRLQELIK